MAITSSTDIGNLACDLLNAGRVNDIESPANALEEMCNRWYTHSRRSLLRQHPWNFATKRVVLAASATTPEFAAEKQFPVPADFLRLLYISDEDGRILSHTEYYFEGKNILKRFTDDDVCYLVYIADEEDVTKFDDVFIDLLAVEMALKMCFKVTQSNGDVERLVTIRKGLVMVAKAIDGQERPPEIRRSSVNRRARMTLSSRNYTQHEF